MFAAKMVRPSGFEPLAFRLGGGRSILLSYGRIWNFWCHWRTNYAHLGGGRSIQLSYGNIYKNYEIVELATFSLPSQGERWNTFLGGGRSIQLSYRDICEIF